jgi:multidrug efflux pump subunit AcrB
MNLPRFSIDNYQLTLTGFAVLLFLGLTAFFTMPQTEDPTLDIPTVAVIAVYPGASPEDVESQVVDPIEDAIQELDDIKEIRTVIRDGVAIVEVEFSFGVDSDSKYDAVQRQVNQVRGDLPAGLYQLDVRRFATNTVSIFQIALVGETASYQALKKEAERIKRLVEQVNGVSKVSVEAYPDPEVHVALDPVKMRAMNIGLDDVERAIRGNNANIPGGAIKVSGRLFNVKTSGAYEDLEQIRQTSVGAYEGRLVYLRQIAEVDFAYEEARWLARFNGERCVFITVQQKNGYNIFDVANPIKAKLAKTALPTGQRLEMVFDQSNGVRERVSGFLGNLGQGIALVGLVVFLALGARLAAIVMMAIPLSILIGLFVVDRGGFGLQQMSIAGLVVALGLLVDNSIAITENISRFLAMGYSRREAAIAGTRQLTTPIISATLTTVLAFVPIIAMPGTTGAFIKALPTTVIATLGASLLVALTLTPLVAAWILLDQQGRARLAPLSPLFRRLVEGPYRRMLDWVFRRRALTLSLALAAFLSALALFPLVGVGFFPKAEKPQFSIAVNLSNGANLDAVDEAVRHVESVLDEYPQVKYHAANIGHGNPRIYYNVAPVNYSNSYGELFVVLKEYEVDAFYALLEELRARFRDYPWARIDVREFVQGPPSEAPVAIKVFGPDLEKLREYTLRVESIVRATPGAINIDNPLRAKSTDLFLRVNRDKAVMLGVPVVAVDQTVRGYVNGAQVGAFRDRDGEEYDIVMRYAYNERFRHEDFERISVRALSGHFVPLRQLADIQFKEAPSRVDHLDGARTASVLADVAPGYTLDAVVDPIRVELEKLEWENGYFFAFKGDVENREESFGGMGMASLVALALIFGVLIVQFRSFSQPLIIFSALPLAVIGSILALLATGIAFSFTAFIGLTSLIGIAINNSIVLVDFANAARAEGASPMEAAKQAGAVRFKPIVLTTLTTILGLLPLTLTGGSLWAPMGWTIIGGLLSSTVLALLVTPILYQLFTR